ncbi:CRISPR-associated helicase Cas3' [Anaerosporobacter sp.]|uniref:CRISPR-associated helicase Cas3' n=1 Tax=Anaerosporobacter sp. TaxID=1872529 RepID=UPI00286F5347|nr:CRISPR-associated helicase Cas3' [Anaerosporobacter sp.]
MKLENYLAKSNPDKSLLEHTQDVLNELEVLKKLGYISDERLYELTKKACHYHDYGKANKAFQERIKNKKRFNELKEVPHNVLSLYFVNPNDFDTTEDYYRVAEVVANHHNYGDTREIISEKEELIVSLLSEFQEELFEVKGRKVGRIMTMLKDDDATLIKGYLHRCDYSASAEQIVEYPNDFLIEKLNGMMNRWQQSNIKAGNKKTVEWNALQQFCLEHTDDNLIITAQTGMGKTEAGLLWLGNHKGFFVLPIRTAINAIYDRIRKQIIEGDKLEERLALLHSENLSYYVANVEIENLSSIEYRLRSRQLCMPITVTTLDQIFDFVFKYGGYEMKLATLSYSKLIIDEIQMYGADLLAYLIYGIAMITKFGGKVAILTATLSPFVRDLLVERGFVGNVVENSFTNDMIRHNLKVYKEKIQAEYIIEKYLMNKQQGIGNKILVVCNTVKNAQRIYTELSGIIDESELHILHNKFIKMARSQKEEDILAFGQTHDKEGNIDIGNGIWVATSIVEASLDIDFDYLYTELSDLNGLLQRLGRCNRKGEKPVEDYNCFVFTEIDENLFVKGERGFIDKKIYDLSKESLCTVKGKLSEDDKIKLINEYFTSEKLKGSDYMRRFESTWETLQDLNVNEFEKSEVKLRNIISYTIIPASVYYDKQDEIDSHIEKYDDKEVSAEERIRCVTEVKKYTMSVEPYVISATSKKAQKIEKIINLGKYEKIYVIDCKYTDIGFQMKDPDSFTFW